MKKVTVATFFTLITALVVHAQELSFDPGMTSSPAGGTGPFDSTTTDFYNGSTDQVFTTGAVADFDGTPGTVTVSAAPTANGLQVNATSAGTYTFNGDPIMLATGNGGTLISIGNGDMYSGSNAANVVFSAPIDIVQGGTATSPTTVYNTYYNTTSDTTTTYNAIEVTGGADNATNQLDFNSYGGGTINFDGAVTDATVTATTGTPANLRLGNDGGSASATYVLGTGFSIGSDFNAIQYSAGTTLIDTDNINVGSMSLGNGGTVETGVAGLNITQTFYGVGGTLGGASTGETTYSGGMYTSTSTTFSAVNGGRVDFTGGIYNQNTVTIGGTGVISFDGYNNYGGPNVATGSPGVAGTVVNSGATLLLNSPSGSSSTGGVYAGTTDFVQVNAGATLGGTGSTVQNVQAVGATSTFSPGDMNAAKISSVGMLTLSGGLTASSGATFNIDLNGTGANDTIAFDGSNLVLSGTVVFNFTNLGGALGTGPYDILTDFSPTVTGGSSELGTIFDFNGPAGYLVTEDPSDLLPGATNFAVDFTAVPEPSTWAMLLGGVALLLGFQRFRRQSL